MAMHRSGGRAAARTGLGADLMASAMAFVFVALVAAAAVVGHGRVADERDGAGPARHMASLSEIQAVVRKAQSESER